MAVRAQLIQMTAEKFELFTRLYAATEESDKNFEELAGRRGARDYVEGLGRSIVNQSVAAIYAFVKHVGFPLVDCFRTGLEEAYAGIQPPFPYTLTHVPVVGVTSVEVQSSVPPGGEAGGSDGTTPSAHIHSKPSTISAIGSRGRSKRARR